MVMRRASGFWPRFSLRMLLVAVTMLSVALAWWSHRAREQQRVLARIAAAGGSYQYEGDQWDEFGNPLPRSSPVPNWLVAWLGVDYFHNVVDVAVTNRDVLYELDRLPGLQSVRILANAVTASHIQAVARLRQLNELDAQGDGLSTELTDKSLALIGEMPQLESVFILGSGFSIEGLERLGASRSLRIVSVEGCHEDVDAIAADNAFHSEKIERLVIGRQLPGGGIERIVDSARHVPRDSRPVRGTLEKTFLP
jgi:hypothetical protein